MAKSPAQEPPPGPTHSNHPQPCSAPSPGRISHLLALRGVMLKGGPGRPRAFGNRSTHICSFPWGGRHDPAPRRATPEARWCAAAWPRAWSPRVHGSAATTRSPVSTRAWRATWPGSTASWLRAQPPEEALRGCGHGARAIKSSIPAPGPLLLIACCLQEWTKASRLRGWRSSGNDVPEGNQKAETCLKEGHSGSSPEAPCPSSLASLYA